MTQRLHQYRRRPAGLAATTLAAVLVFGALPAAAQTSSWQQRIEEAPKPVKPQAVQKPAAKVQSQPVAPSAAPAIKLPGLPYPEAAKAGPKTPLGPATTSGQSSFEKGGAGGDPAYEAFDQGKYLTALDLAQKAAAKGDPQAHTLIGRIHAEGLGVPQSEATAADWYKRGVALGDIEAAFALGVLHARGATGIERNYTEAAKLFEIAAAKEHALANYNLGLLFLRGQGRPENPHRAFAHIRYAAWRGVVPAQYDLGTLFATGTGVEANAFEAARWIEKAADAGHAEAQIEFATTLFKVDAPPGDAVALEKQKAAEKRGAQMFRSAAEKGYPLAQNRLARCYAYGKGVTESTFEAVTWHLIAKSGGVDDELLETLIKKLSRADRVKAEAAAEEWRERWQVQ
jgi:TPR repeat protein